MSLKKADDTCTPARGDLVGEVVAGSTRSAAFSVAQRRPVHASTGRHSDHCAGLGWLTPAGSTDSLDAGRQAPSATILGGAARSASPHHSASRHLRRHGISGRR
ncbi:hypothetical protein [Streptomyces mirabilis]|uniref:hypothetical protein n=1 Tax=Streptomyces mirabilis TaxID=68239 RepID=UPI00224E5DD1|nr:hypothetical protein [Streptomyces mirabilis]MCX4418506.1 hypothetical protein [Streptomyces mirabilis]